MTTPTIHIDLTETFGIGYIGSILSAILYGITCIQTFHYFRASSKDPVTLKALVSVLLTIAVEIIVNAFIAFLVEGFLVARVWILSGKKAFMTVICAVLTMAHLAMNIAFPVKTLDYANLITGAEKLRTFGTAGLAVAVVTDVCISATLCYYLQRGRTGFKKSDDIITKLIALTITTGLLSTLIVIANLVALVAAPEKLYSLFFNFMLAKLYINALLTSLNARAAIRNSQSAKSSLSNTLSDFIPSTKVGTSSRGDTTANLVVDIESFTTTEPSGHPARIEMGKMGSHKGSV
ncbi:hypothetical protein HGRIS_013790 [Hohenbuehelia grisea]|uniref:DUF6534 domain-containing protein n=1 Tax=Hohenbuehelia grisea TaxID=104357 RepID=A0ABR3IWG4_9AGAR